MRKYLDAVEEILAQGVYKKNRTGVDTIANFGQHYEFDLADGFPLLTTKKMDTFRWDSMLHELVWYLSGEHHIRNLRENTKIWDAWADEDWNLPSAYGRFWRRFPVPEEDSRLPGEVWTGEDCPWVGRDDVTGTLVFDQISYVVDTLRGENPNRDPNSRRLVVTAWHPANAAESTLPPCHYTYALNVQGGRLNCHLTQRSADTALGVPFNIAAYSLLTKLIAEITDLEPGVFSHTLVDAHIYCGKEKRGKWYASNLGLLQERLDAAVSSEDYREIRRWLLDQLPPEDVEDVDPISHKYGYDHVPGLLEQLSRDPLEKPSIDIETESIDEFAYEDVELRDYESHGDLIFKVAE